jgi:hypothetical protein
LFSVQVPSARLLVLFTPTTLPLVASTIRESEVPGPVEFFHAKVSVRAWAGAAADLATLSATTAQPSALVARTRAALGQ